LRIVLLVEDDPDDIYFLSNAFEDLLPDVLLKVAKHGDEAIAYLSGRGGYSNRREYPLPSLAILDLALPYGSGLDLLAWLRAPSAHPALPVAVLSGSARRGDVDRAAMLGINAYFTKPVDFRELADFVRAPSVKRVSAAEIRARLSPTARGGGNC
jgi:CheY-like chemotaxis protein